MPCILLYNKGGVGPEGTQITKVCTNVHTCMYICHLAPSGYKAILFATQSSQSIDWISKITLVPQDTHVCKVSSRYHTFKCPQSQNHPLSHNFPHSRNIPHFHSLKMSHILSRKMFQSHGSPHTMHIKLSKLSV